VLLAQVSLGEAAEVGRLGLSSCGLAMEYLLQVTYRPVLTARRRNSTGGWTARRLDSSRSLGAISSSKLPGLFEAVRAGWDELAAAPIPTGGRAVTCHFAGRTVFPALTVPS
jgi:hypothetical protein